MSTLKVNNLQDINGANNSTPEQVAQGRAKAWVDFNGQGTVAIRDSFNVSSITDNATGNYTVNFSSTFPNAHYAAFANAGNGVNIPAHTTLYTKNSNNLNFRTSGLNVNGATHTDPSLVSVVIFAD
tara:strand:+ start:1052 stop:1429 length:378 start_codon:yes stop_codon:yes gene_type:complete